MSEDNTTDSPTNKAPDSAHGSVEPAPIVTAAGVSHVPNLPVEPVAATPPDTSGPEGRKPPALSSAAIDPIPSMTANANASNAPDSILPKAKQTITPSAYAARHQELRFAPRVHVRWHADALIDGKDIYHGFVKDISLKGTDFFLNLNLQKIKFIELRIHLPPLSKTSKRHFMEVTGKVIYTAYDSNESLFHTGVNFTHFNLESDQAYLKSRLAAYIHSG